MTGHQPEPADESHDSKTIVHKTKRRQHVASRGGYVLHLPACWGEGRRISARALKGHSLGCQFLLFAAVCKVVVLLSD